MLAFTKGGLSDKEELLAALTELNAANANLPTAAVRDRYPCEGPRASSRSSSGATGGSASATSAAAAAAAAEGALGAAAAAAAANGKPNAHSEGVAPPRQL